jgi:hypothetical protein
MHITVEPMEYRSYVKVAVELSSDEGHIVRRKNLWGEVLRSRPNPNYQIQLDGYNDLMESYTWRKAHAGWLEKKVFPVVAPTPPNKEIHVSPADVCRPSGHIFKFETFPQAQVFIIDLRERILPWLKTLMTVSSTAKKQTFDL